MGSIKQRESARKLCIERNTTHGLSRTEEYKIWKGIVKRCCNPNCSGYEYYGGRGITIHPQWKNDFISFLDHIGKRPSKKHSVDRIDNSKGYVPGNVRWATRLEQNNNSRKNRILCINGEEKTISQWSKVSGIDHRLIWNRLRLGWVPKDAVFLESGGLGGWKHRGKHSKREL